MPTLKQLYPILHLAAHIKKEILSFIKAKKTVVVQKNHSKYYEASQDFMNTLYTISFHCSEAILLKRSYVLFLEEIILLQH